MRRVETHRRWNPEDHAKLRGVPWGWNPDAGMQPGDPMCACPYGRREAERQARCVRPGDSTYRSQLRRENFLHHRSMDSFPGCQAALPGTSRQGHSEACRARMEEVLGSSPGGQMRVSRQVESLESLTVDARRVWGKPCLGQRKWYGMSRECKLTACIHRPVRPLTRAQCGQKPDEWFQ